MSLAMRQARYAVGDPGLFGFIGKALGAVGSIVPGPIGAITKLVGGALAPKPISVAKASVGMSALPGGVLTRTAQPGNALLAGTLQTNPFSGVKLGPIQIGTSKPGVGLAPTGQGVTGPLVGTPSSTPCTSGYHFNKSRYYSTRYGVVEKGTVCVKNRRRNPLNPRALSRAMSRVKSAQKAVRCLQLFAGPAARASAKGGKIGRSGKGKCRGGCR